MKFSLHVNQKQAIDLGITNINQAHIFDLLTGVAAWASPVLIDGEVFYWVARQSIAKELQLLNLKPDTIYRHLKTLAELGLIDYEKEGKKDCIRLTKRGKSYYVGSISEEVENSDLNPDKLGNESENNSDLNPTDQATTNINQLNNQPIKFDVFYSLFPKKVGRKDAERIWLKLDPEKQQLAIDGIKSFAAGKAIQFISAPAVYLGGDRWTDESFTPENPNQPPAIRSSSHKPAAPLDSGTRSAKNVAKAALQNIKSM